MCKQTDLRFCISRRVTFSNSIAFTMINEFGKGALVQVLTVFDPFSLMLLEGSIETGLSRQLSNHVFRSP